MEKKKTIVVSAVNLNVGGTLTILRDCLSYLSSLNKEGDYRIIAVVYDKDLAYYPYIEYIENKWPKKSWLNRLWYEYISLNKISKQIGPVFLWLSLHDTTPNVIAERQAVYCHNPFPFYHWKFKEILFAPKIVGFSLFSKLIYQKGIHRNLFVIVQQQWIKDAFKRMFGLAKDKIIVALPTENSDNNWSIKPSEGTVEIPSFIYAASPNSHKNFECLCEATRILAINTDSEFNVKLTIDGTENAYSKWLYKKWGSVKQIKWEGFQDRKSMFKLYNEASCLVFPSKVETWGLPITEFASFKKPMLLANLPYAKETAASTSNAAFFNSENPQELAELMLAFIEQKKGVFSTVPEKNLEEPVSKSWEQLFSILLK
ncbi:glycosyltransferase [Sphingobacterium humi]|uniref:Glycosyltransferase n=1 Tax=Sphingobacterium humi TaxID=1796905 RepID=A0A6N8KU45_9SPHI|nr:glycosyltransferase [Sphingobacterium humi]MVZ60980.1 glycosyltransferase [Sphingobacterium humi]